MPLVTAYAKRSHAPCKDPSQSSMTEHTDEIRHTEEADVRMEVCRLRF